MTPAPGARWAAPVAVALALGLLAAAGSGLADTAQRLAATVPSYVWTLIALLAAAVLVLTLRALVAARRRADQRREACLATVRTLAATVEARDPCTFGHLERVSKLGLLLAREAAPREARDPQMFFGFMLHDVGKLAVPDGVLHKPGLLTAEEREIIRRHPHEGARIIGDVPFLAKAREVVLHHHERWDGGGYPDMLAGDAIPLWARIFAVADTLDAMTSERPYGRRFTLDEALEEIAACAGTQFDPRVVYHLAKLPREHVLELLEAPAAREHASPAAPRFRRGRPSAIAVRTGRG